MANQVRLSSLTSDFLVYCIVWVVSTSEVCKCYQTWFRKPRPRLKVCHQLQTSNPISCPSPFSQQSGILKDLKQSDGGYEMPHEFTDKLCTESSIST